MRAFQDLIKKAATERRASDNRPAEAGAAGVPEVHAPVGPPQAGRPTVRPPTDGSQWTFADVTRASGPLASSPDSCLRV